ncbi:MAG: radical SAM protein, partial [Desulfobacteraceae bacterium]
VAYPKVYLDLDETFECAGKVADNYFVFPNGRVYRCPVCEDYPLHGFEFSDDELIETESINERDLFELEIVEGCVMNKLIQPANIAYDGHGRPAYRIACCLLKQQLIPDY